MTRYIFDPDIVTCPDCGLTYPTDSNGREAHTDYHAYALPLLAALREWSGCSDFSQAQYEALKSRYREIFAGYDHKPHTDEELITAAIGYLRVRSAHAGLWSVLHEHWPEWIRLYPTFALWARSNLRYYSHEFSPRVREALAAYFHAIQEGASHE